MFLLRPCRPENVFRETTCTGKVRNSTNNMCPEKIEKQLSVHAFENSAVNHRAKEETHRFSRDS
jgi:hypothetical protein